MRFGIHHVCGVSSGFVTVMIFIRRTKTKFDDLLVTNKTAKYIAHLIPLLLFTNQFLSFCSAMNIGKAFGKLVGLYCYFGAG
jgi:miniconductance mechanosensitive channel